MASSQQVVSPNRKPHLMGAYTTVVNADVRVGLVWHSFGTSDLHLFPAPTLRQFGTSQEPATARMRTWQPLSFRPTPRLASIAAKHKTKFSPEGHSDQRADAAEKESPDRVTGT